MIERGQERASLLHRLDDHLVHPLDPVQLSFQTRSRAVS